MRYWALLIALIVALPLAPVIAEASAADHPEPRPFAEGADAQAALADAMQAAAANGRNVIVIMGANWCHDSRALAGWFASARFAAMIERRYNVVYIDVGTPQTGNGRNLDIAKRFGVKKMKNTPLVLVLSRDGKLLNSRKDAVSWRNAASRSENAIFAYFDNFTPA